MSDTTAQSAQGAFSIESSTPTGRSIANGILTKNITSRVKGDPSIDLSQFLQQQAELYPQLCKNLSQRRDSNSSSSSTSSQTDEKDQGSVSATKAASQFQLTNNTNIIYSLDDSIVVLAGAQQTPTEPESEYLAALASGLNQAINDSQTLWRLHNMLCCKSAHHKLSRSAHPLTTMVLPTCSTSESMCRRSQRHIVSVPCNAGHGNTHS
ncbi:hypothetical protein NXS19_014199 [Fusarium pseudograminearum]|nr:hypothetical protein NXS19_014199 [Fusarium pseudograminearum]